MQSSFNLWPGVGFEPYGQVMLLHRAGAVDYEDVGPLLDCVSESKCRTLNSSTTVGTQDVPLCCHLGQSKGGREEKEEGEEEEEEEEEGPGGIDSRQRYHGAPGP
ncbi:unnamed protein product [Boreogadus saida]